MVMDDCIFDAPQVLLIIAFLHRYFCFLEGSPCDVAADLYLLCEVVSCRYCVMCFYLGGVSYWVVSFVQPEGCVSCSAVKRVIICKLSSRDPIHPFALLLCKNPKVLSYLLIDSFGLSICLGMIGGTNVELDVKKPH